MRTLVLICAVAVGRCLSSTTEDVVEAAVNASSGEVVAAFPSGPVLDPPPAAPRPVVRAPAPRPSHAAGAVAAVRVAEEPAFSPPPLTPAPAFVPQAPAPASPVYVDGQKTVTLRGETIAEDFERIINDYVRSTYGGEPTTAELRAPKKTIAIRKV